MTKTICLDKNFSTTRLLTEKKPIIENSPEYKFETILFLPEDENRQGEGGLRTKWYFKKSYDNKPLLTIITVVFNGAKHLEQTIESVINQSYDNIEYIIIDGGSTDGTLDIIKKYEIQIDYWVSEPDKGIYDAMNKGINVSTGDYIAFINADDWYHINAISTIVNTLSSENDLDFLYANINFVLEDDSYLNWKGNTGKNGTHIPHPACFIKSYLLKEEGFNTDYRIAADYEMTLRLFNNENVKTKYLDFTVANFRTGGTSSAFYTTTKEDFVITRKYFGLLKAIKNLMQKIFSYSRRFFA